MPLDLIVVAESAVEAIRDGNEYGYSECLRDLESAGCSSRKIQQYLTRAGWTASDEACLLLLRAQHTAESGETHRANQLRAEACALVGEDEVVALTEEFRFTFTAPPVYSAVPERRVRAGFVL